MATNNIACCIHYYFLSASFILVFLSTHYYCLIQAKSVQDDIQHLQHSHTHSVQVSSLISSSDTCNPSLKGGRRGSSLEVSHNHGPCSPLNSDSDKASRSPTQLEVLERDQDRVDSILERVKPKSAAIDRVRQKAVALPAKSGSTIGSGNFIVTVGLGTPKKDLSLIFDTGSDFTWTQCEPCVKSCYKQKESIFDPSTSSTYTNITCTSPLCTEVRSATSATPGCSSSTCVYGIQYGDSSFSVGFFAKDTLTLASDSVPNILFGCGENNQGLFGGSAGLIGLGRNKMSIVSQTASKYGGAFSYCLPSKSTSTGHLTFGKDATNAKAISYTPLKTSSQGPSFYFIDLLGISVGGRKLSISSTVFTTAGTVIDSGTVITRLPPAAYSALQSAFSQLMSKYPKAPALSILDTCYDLSNLSTVQVPKISLFFGGGAELDLQLPGILYVKDLSQVCLAFAGNSDATDVAILGNVQQLTFDVVYDVAAAKLGFSPGGCL